MSDDETAAGWRTMRAMFERLESKWLWLAGVALLALLTTVAVLQFHWITQLAEADRRQRQELLATAVGNIRRDFAETVNRVVPFFRRSSGIQPDTDIEGRLNELVTLWQRENRFPLLESAGLGVETAGGKTVYKLRRLNDAQFISLPWPEELSLYRQILEKRLRRPTGEPPLYPRGFATELVDGRPVIVFPIVEERIPVIGGEEVQRREPFAQLNDSRALLGMLTPSPKGASVQAVELKGWVFLELDEEFLQTGLIPELIERHFGERGQDSFQFAVVTGQSSRLVFQSEPELTIEKLSSPDARISIFNRQIQSPLPEFVPPFRSGRRRGGFRPPNGGRRMERPGNEMLVEPVDQDAWQLVVKHKTGSLAEVVSRTRRRNLILSFGVLLIMGGSMALLALAARRSRRLASQQMEFVAGISHELRTPLAVIQSTSFNLARGTVADPNRVQQYGKTIQAEVRRLSNQVEQILGFAGIQSGRKLYDLQPVDAVEIVERALGELAASFDEEGWRVEKHIASALPKVMADSQALESVIKNLIQNAIKYAAEGKWLGITVEAGKGQQVKITVADRGAGIEAKDLPHIFKPFYRSRQVLASPVAGAGLGLSLVERHMRAMNGSVMVESSVGKGSAFTLHLPATDIN
ncbi:MAG: sensor histidine kinase [Blastocatellales bacterium]